MLKNRPAQRCVALLLLAAALFLLSRDSTSAGLLPRDPSQDPAQLPVISIAPQGDVPFRIIDASLNASDQESIVVKLAAQNQSRKTIRAYTILTDHGGSKEVTLTSLRQPALLLQPTQIKTIEVAYSKLEVPQRISLSVDFVEFSDGSTWGPDEHKSIDMLAGQREGAKVERQRLRELLKAKGPSTTLDSIKEVSESDVKGLRGPKHSEEWIQGFRSGIGSMRSHVKQALQAGDSKRAELELAKPFDSSESNQP